VPPYESPVRRLAADAAGRPYRALRTLEEARAADDGVVVIDGDLGGQVLAVAPARLVRCDTATLHQLAQDLDAHLRPSDGGDGADVWFERHHPGDPIASGGGGDDGVALTRVWVHDELVQAGLAPAVRAVLSGSAPHLEQPGGDRPG
jgi:hypothetical protein